MIKIEEARKILGRTYTTEFGGMTFHYKPVNLLLDVSTTEEKYEFFALLAVMNKDGKVIKNDNTLYDAQTFVEEIEKGNLKQV